MPNKDAEKLADRVRRQGYEVNWDGHVYIVLNESGDRIAQFAGGSGLSASGLALTRAVTELRRKGILPRDHHEEERKRMKGKKVASNRTIHPDERDELAGRVEVAMRTFTMSQGEFARTMSENENDHTQYQPLISKLLRKQGGISPKNAEKINRTLDSLNGLKEIEPFVEPPEEDKKELEQKLIQAIEDPRDEAQILKALLEEAEKERDAALNDKKNLEQTNKGLQGINAQLNNDRKVLEERLVDALETPNTQVDKISMVVTLLNLGEHEEWLLRKVFAS